MGVKKLIYFSYKLMNVQTIRSIMTEYINLQTASMKEEHSLLCGVINNLQQQLDSANKRREEIRHKMNDREYIDSNLASADYWLDAYNVGDEQDMTVVEANLHSIVRALNTCDCCERHMCNRPESIDDVNCYVKREVVLEKKPKTECCCLCRQTSRNICRALCS